MINNTIKKIEKFEKSKKERKNNEEIKNILQDVKSENQKATRTEV